MFSFMAVYGCPGFISSVACWAPDISYSIYEAAVARDFDKLAELENALAPYPRFIDKVTANHGPHTGIGAGGGSMYIGCEKAAMDIVGIRGGEPRLPCLPITDEEKAELRGIMRAMKVIK